MDAQTVLRIRPELTRFLRQFDDCFGRCTTRRYLGVYVMGQLGPLPRKSLEPMADAAGEPPRNLQQFLSLFSWDHGALRDQLQRHVARTQADPESIGIIDETTFVKKGHHTAGVQHQYCGAAGKQANCVMSVHLGYARPNGFHTLLDGAVYLPQETWHEDRPRCRQSGVPDEYVYRPKWQMALDQLARATANGLRLKWLVFDEAYTDAGPFRRELEARGQNYVGELPSDFKVWTKFPKALYRRHEREGERVPGARPARLKVQSNPRVKVCDVLAHSPILRRVGWVTYRVKDGTKGPMLWEAKRIMVFVPDGDGWPGAGQHLLVARNVLNPAEVKYFLSNAPPETTPEQLLLVAFSRWHIERVFGDTKEELGLDHFECRQWVSIQRHLILSCVSHLFLAEFRQRHGEKKSRPDAPAGAGGGRGTGGDLELWGPLFAAAGGADRRGGTTDPAAQCQGSAQRDISHTPPNSLSGYPFEPHQDLQVAGDIAL